MNNLIVAKKFASPSEGVAEGRGIKKNRPLGDFLLE
jgi:hypothetical protein